MKYRCKKCKKFIADYRDEKNFDIYGKSVSVTPTKIFVTCRKCGEIMEIKKGD